MKVLLINGSPHTNGCTYTAFLQEIVNTLKIEGIDSDIFQVGTKPLAGCIACKVCAEKGQCVFNDRVNEFLDVAKDFDGFIFGSPVHYVAASGAITSFMDRALYQRMFRKKFVLFKTGNSNCFSKTCRHNRPLIS